MSEAEDQEEMDEALVVALPGEAATAKDIALWVGLLVILALVVYWPTTAGRLVWNDAGTVNPGTLRSIWIPGAGGAPYHPVANTLAAVLFHFFGQDEKGIVQPFEFHVANLVLHCGSVVLVWLILRQLNSPGSWVAAALFAVHPINVEPVAQISGLATVLAGALFLGAVYCYLRFAQDDQWEWYLAAFALFVLALLSKPMAWGVAPVLLVLLWWQRKLSAKHFVCLTPLLVIGIGGAVAAAVLADKAGSDVHLSIGQRLILAGETPWIYLAKIIVPLHLSIIYPIWNLDAASPVQYAPLVAGLLVMLALWGLDKTIGRGPLAAGKSFIICLLPVMGLIPLATMSQSFVFDHAAYLAVIPVVAMVVAVVTAGLRSIGKGTVPTSAAVGLSAVLLIAAGAGAWQHASAFADPVSLWTDTVAKNPLSAFAHDRLAQAFGEQAESALGQGDQDGYKAGLQSALDQARLAASLDSNDAEAQSTWGRILRRNGDSAGAVEHLRLSIQISPTLVARQELATQLMDMKQYDPAIEQLDAALRIDPQAPRTHRLLGEAFEAKGNLPRAIGEQKEALAIEPQDTAAQMDLAKLLYKTGDEKGAMVQFLMVAEQQHKLQLDDPDHQHDDPEIWNAIGRLEARKGDMSSAITAFNSALNIDPNNVEAKKNLALANGALEKQRLSATTRSTTQAATQPQ